MPQRGETMLLRHFCIFSVWAVVAMGCAFESGDAPMPPPEPLTVMERIERGPTFAIVAPRATVEMDVRFPRSDTPGVQSMTLIPDRGALVVRALDEERLKLKSMELELDERSLGADTFPPRGMTLRNVHLQLAGETSADAQWSSGESEGHARLEGTLLLDWSVLLDAGSEWPLAQQEFAGVPLDVQVGTDAQNNLIVELSAAIDGPVWSWGGVVEVSNLRLYLPAIEEDTGS